MPYIGNELATQFQAFVTQTITGDGSTGYTLDRAVANGKELLVYINNVKQEEGSGKAYTASGTTITFSAAVASTDSCYLVYMGSAQQTVTAPAGSIVSSQFSSADLVLPKTVTIGSAGAEDTKLVFDGNAQDFHVGLDDSADSLTIGLGSTLGTTSHMVIDANGHITKPLQPAFLVKPTSAQYNVSGSDVTIVLDNEIFDQNADFNTSNYTFTAPVTGKYYLSLNLYVDQMPNDASYFEPKIVTSNRTYYGATVDNEAYDQTVSYLGLSFSLLVDMDASDTALCKFTQPNGTASADINVVTTFSGHLVC